MALNAAVEAARAGEQGRGFAVVAIEVRELSKRTSEAAQEVKTLIAESTDRVQAGRQQTLSARSAMEKAQASVTQVSELIQSISGGAKELHLGIMQINETVTLMDSMTQQNAALVEENAGNSIQVSEKTKSVLDSVSIFNLSAGDTAKMTIDAVELRRAANARRLDHGMLPK
ncbi:MAG: methyl-accepting chemotaxis protein [Burkholderiaceae bacterium]